MSDNLQHRCDNCEGIDPASCMNAPVGDRRQRYAEALAAAFGPFAERELIVSRIMLARDEELETLHSAYSITRAQLKATRQEYAELAGVVAQLSALHQAHDCAAHVLDRTPTPCTNAGYCSCGQLADRCRERAILSSLPPETPALLRGDA